MSVLSLIKKNLGLVLILLLSSWAIRPLLMPGFFPMHDDTQVARVFEMGKMLGNGVFPVRWVPDLGYGYGYPLFNFYAPLAYYVGGLFILLGFNALAATKLMMALGIILAGVFMYLLAKKFFGELGGIVSGLFYVYAPYHAVDIYVRGDVAEFWGYAFIPLAFLGIYKNNILIGALGFAGIILSHNLTAMMVTPFILIVILLNCYIAFRKKQLSTFNSQLSTLALGLGISAFYWVPALLEFKNTNVLSQIGGGADFRDHFVCIGQLWSSNWGFGGSTKGCIDGMSFMIGKLHILVTGSVLLLFLLGLIKQHKRVIFFFLISFLLSFFLMLEASRFLWEVIPVMAFFQYPWRFLILTSFFSSILSGFMVWFLGKAISANYFNTLMYYSGAILVFFLLFFNIKLFVPQNTFQAAALDFTNERTLKWTTSKISDEYLPPDFKKPKSEKEVWQEPVPFQETAVQKASNTVSIIGVLALIIGIILRYGKNKR